MKRVKFLEQFRQYDLLPSRVDVGREKVDDLFPMPPAAPPIPEPAP